MISTYSLRNHASKKSKDWNIWSVEREKNGLQPKIMYSEVLFKSDP